MKLLLRFLLGGLLAVTITGCETMTFSKYAGEQRAWPTANAFTEAVFDVPVYRGWPERAYEVLGFVQFANPNIDWNRGDMKLAARKAKEMGGDAMIVMPKGHDPSPTAITARQQLGISGAQSTGIVVKWK